MGFGAKLNFAFIAVIVVMALTQCGFALFMDFSKSRARAQAALLPLSKYADTELIAIYRRNFELARAIEADGEFKKAISAKDRGKAAAIVKSFFDRAGFSGYATIIQENGQVLYSSDTPSKFGYMEKEENRPIVFKAFSFSGSGQFPFSLCSLSITDGMTLASFMPVRVDNKVPAVLAVSTPFGNDLLLGMERKIKLVNESSKEIEMAFYVLPGSKVTALSASLANAKPTPSYLEKLSNAREDPFNNQSVVAESDGRLWKNLRVTGPDGSRPIGQILVCVPVQNPLANVPQLAAQLAVAAGVAFLLSCLFSAGMSKRFAVSMRFLKQRVKDLAANRQDLPTLGTLGGDWLELAEMMDTAMTSPRAIMLSLKQTVAKQQEELNERQRQVDAINNQLELVNRQLTAHNRSASEVGTQVQTVQKQAVQVQQKLEAVLQCSTEGFLLLDQFGSVLAANPIFLSWIGQDERDIAGKRCYDLIRKQGQGRETQTISFANPSGRPEDLINQFFPEGTIYHKYQDKQVDVLMHLQPVVNEENLIQGYIMVLRDKSLHAEVARLRNEIVHMLSHDIRAPLAKAESRWKTLLTPSSLQNMPPSFAQSLLELSQIHEHMLGVADSYLMLYGGFVPAPEPGQREQVSVTRLIGECLESVSQKARAQQIMLDYKTVTGLPNTAINRDIVRDIIVQLLEKMISVTAPGGRVRAETTIKGKEIRLIISSSGPALQQGEIEELFVGFIDGRHAEDTYQSRLNMYLARNNAERLGGRIWAESEAGRGTAIFLTLPVH